MSSASMLYGIFILVPLLVALLPLLPHPLPLPPTGVHLQTGAPLRTDYPLLHPSLLLPCPRKTVY